MISTSAHRARATRSGMWVQGASATGMVGGVAHLAAGSRTRWAIARPMAPRPKRPTFWRCADRARARRSPDSQRPSRTWRSDWTSRRAAASHRAMARSATSSSSAPVVVVTITPLSRVQFRSTASSPTPLTVTISSLGMALARTGAGRRCRWRLPRGPLRLAAAGRRRRATPRSGSARPGSPPARPAGPPP